jgi:hypothetical protein
MRRFPSKFEGRQHIPRAITDNSRLARCYPYCGMLPSHGFAAHNNLRDNRRPQTAFTKVVI